jgi:tetratricopeptide (TPR) repeat protein
MTARRLAGHGAVAWMCAILAAAACTSHDGAASASSTGAPVLRPPEGLGLRSVSLPDFSLIEEPVREQLRERYSSSKLRIEKRGATPAELSAAYGEMGKLLMAAQYLDAAESCYLNAQALAPSDRRWPYYLGHLYKIKGPLAKSVASFEQALQLQPSDVATLVWLGDVYLTQGRAEAAEPLFAKALTLQPNSVSARFGAGRAALARKDYARAANYLEEALALGPRAANIHYPLAMAYRGLGELEKAQAQLRQQGDSEMLPADPLMQELDELLQSPMAYDVRGTRTLDIGDWAAAAALFRKGLDLAPTNASLRHKLGTALFQMGDARGAQEQFEQVVQMSPEFTKAHYSLGILLEASGRYQEAIDRFSTALKYGPSYVQARVRLADVLRRTGHLKESLMQYDQVLQTDPNLSEAAFGYAMTLVRMQRYQEARGRLAQGMKVYSDQPEFAHALARLLAASPDPRVRDGRRAMALVTELRKKHQSIDLGETLAMTLAELGQYEQAAAVQRDVMAAARQAGVSDVVESIMVENLKLYERREPCRTPWRDGEMP